MTETDALDRLAAFGGTMLPDCILLHIRFQAELTAALVVLGGVFDARRKRWRLPRETLEPLLEVLTSHGAQSADPV